MTQTILLVDSVQRSLTALNDALKNHGYAPTVVLHLDDPLAVFAAIHHDLVFINLDCPNAQALCEGIRNDPAGSTTPVLFIGDGTQDIASPTDALAAGGDSYFAVPLDLTKIIAKVQTYVGVPQGPAKLAPVPAPSKSAKRRSIAAMAARVDSLDLDNVPPAPESTGAHADDAIDALGDFGDVPKPADFDPLGNEDAFTADPPWALQKAFEPPEASDAPVPAPSKRKRPTPSLADIDADAELEALITPARKGPPPPAPAPAPSKSPPPPADAPEPEEAWSLGAPADAEREDIAAPPPPAAAVPSQGAPPPADPDDDELDALATMPPRAPSRSKAAPEARMPTELAEAADAVLAQIAEREAELAREAEAKRWRQAEEAAAETQRLAAAAEAARGEEEARQAAAQREAAAQAHALAQRKAEAEAKVRHAVLEAEARAQRENAEHQARRAESQRAEEQANSQLAQEQRARQKALAEVRRAEEQARRRAEEEAVAAATNVRDAAHEPTVIQPRGRAEAPTPPAPQGSAGRLADAATPDFAPSAGMDAPHEDASTAGPAPTLTGQRPLDPPSGQLSGNRDVASLFIDAFEQRVTGRIDVSADQRQKSVFFENGSPVDAYSSQAYDRMEEYLLRHGKITRSQYQEVRGKRLRSARQVGAYLVNEGFLKTEELFAAVRGQLEELYFGLFEWEEATYSFRPEATGESDRVFLEMDPRALVLEGIRRKIAMPRLVAAVGSPSSLVGLTPQAPAIAKAIGLLPDEQLAVRLLDGQRTIEDLVFSSGLDAVRVYQLIYALVLTGAAAILVRGLDTLAADPRQADHIDRARILEKAEQVRFLDYFAMLGISRTATGYEIERACQEATEAFDPSRFSAHVRTEMGPHLQEIVEILGDARYVLGDPDRRTAYANHLP